MLQTALILIISLCFLGISGQRETTVSSQTAESDGCSNKSDKKCADGRCISKFLKCPENCSDFDYKCPDGTCAPFSFSTCNTATTTRPSTCHLKTCTDGRCVDWSASCACPKKTCWDGTCVDYSTSCSGSCPEYSCDTYDQCYSSTERCDGYSDCHDRSDEEHCAESGHTSYSISWWRYLLIPIGGVILFGVLYAAGCRKNALRRQAGARGQMYPTAGAPGVTGTAAQMYPTGTSPGLAGATPMAPIPNGAYPRQQQPYPTGPQGYPTQAFYPGAYPAPPPAYDAAMSYPATSKVPQSGYNEADLPKYEEIGNVGPLPPNQSAVNPAFVGDNPPQNPSHTQVGGRTPGGSDL